MKTSSGLFIGSALCYIAIGLFIVYRMNYYYVGPTPDPTALRLFLGFLISLAANIPAHILLITAIVFKVKGK